MIVGQSGRLLDEAYKNIDELLGENEKLKNHIIDLNGVHSVEIEKLRTALKYISRLNVDYFSRYSFEVAAKEIATNALK